MRPPSLLLRQTMLIAAGLTLVAGLAPAGSAPAAGAGPSIEHAEHAGEALNRFNQFRVLLGRGQAEQAYAMIEPASRAMLPLERFVEDFAPHAYAAALLLAEVTGSRATMIDEDVIQLHFQLDIPGSSRRDELRALMVREDGNWLVVVDARAPAVLAERRARAALLAMAGTHRRRGGAGPDLSLMKAWASGQLPSGAFDVVERFYAISLEAEDDDRWMLVAMPRPGTRLLRMVTVNQDGVAAFHADTFHADDQPAEGTP